MDDASYLPADGGGAINLWTHRPGDGHGTGLQRQAKLPRLGRDDRRGPVIDRPPKQETQENAPLRWRRRPSIGIHQVHRSDKELSQQIHTSAAPLNGRIEH